MPTTNNWKYSEVDVKQGGVHVTGSPVVIPEDAETTTDIINAINAATGFTITIAEAQVLLNTRTFASDLCFACTEELEAGEDYMEFRRAGRDESAYVGKDGESQCLIALNAS